jgi:hypothetical protein
MEVKQDPSRYNACIYYIMIRGKLTVANVSTQLASIPLGKINFPNT